MTRPDPAIADRYAIDAGCTYDPAAAERPVQFLERFCKQSQGRWAREPLALLDWQRELLRRLFGWRRADGTRRYRSAYLEVGKKNGKSTLVSGLVLYLLVADGEPSPKIFLNACDKEQASLIFDEAAAMVRSSPGLSRRLSIVDYRKRIVNPADMGRIQANSREAPNKDGPSASTVVFDELHRQPDRELWDMFEHAGIARSQPLRISLTTAGEDESGVWYEQRDYSERVAAGELPDWGHLGIVYRADPSADLEDPAVWRTANPSLGHIMSEADFAADMRKAKVNELSWNLFKRLRLNIISRSEARFFNPEDWARCGSPRQAVEDFAGRPAYLGADLSRAIDLTALAVVLPPHKFGIDYDPDAPVNVLVWHWIPEDKIDELSRVDRVPYRAWIEAGYVIPTPGNIVDYGFMRSMILRLASILHVRGVLVDPWNATQFASTLANEDGLPVQRITQGFLSLSAPTKELERLVVAGRVAHGNNPVLRWMVSNAIAVRDAAGNVKLDKHKSREKIDGLSAIVNGLAGMIADPGTAPSVYETRGILTL